MDVRAEIFVNIPKFLEEINSQLGAIQLQMSPNPSQLSLAAIQQHSQDTSRPTQTARAAAPPIHTSTMQHPNQSANSVNHPYVAAFNSLSLQLDTSIQTLSPDTASLAAISG